VLGFSFSINHLYDFAHYRINFSHKTSCPSPTKAFNLNLNLRESAKFDCRINNQGCVSLHVMWEIFIRLFIPRVGHFWSHTKLGGMRNYTTCMYRRTSISGTK
jgi:hypothetical protein